MREFQTAVNEELANPEESEANRRELHTKIDGKAVTLYPLTASQLIVVAFNLDSGSIMANAAGILNAFFGMLKTDQQIRHYKARLWDDKDAFGVEMISEVMREALAEWTGNPTQSSGASSSSLEPTGSVLMPQPQQSEPQHRSAFGQTGS